VLPIVWTALARPVNTQHVGHSFFDSSDMCRYLRAKMTQLTAC
jgi:hypothetical protein